nr:histidine phosphatase family protein [Streptomyces specialis]
MSAIPGRYALGELTVVRHGESLANAVFAGMAPPPPEWSDATVPLTARGEAQAAALGAWLAGLGVERRPHLVACSPYERARRTWDVMAREAVRLGRPPVPVVVDQRLRDREMGVFELLTPGGIRERDPGEARRRVRLGEGLYRPPGGESLADVALRARDFLTELDAGGAGRRVLVVAHDAIVVTLRHVVAGIGAEAPADAVPVPNASVTRFAGDGAALRLVEFGATAHLTGPGETADDR